MADSPRYPDFIVIGAMKAGTTALHDHLAKHPNLFVSKKKEPQYFSSPGEGQLPSWVLPTDLESHKRMVVTKAKYQELFSGGGGRIAGESSVMYLHDPSSAARAAAANPEMKVIALLREPAARAFSAWSFLVRLGLEDLDFEQALAAEPHRIMGPGFHYVGMGDYARQLEPWIVAFGRDQVLPIDFARFSHNTSDVINEVCGFLDIDPSLLPEEIAMRNTGGQIPTGRFQRWFVRRVRIIVSDRIPSRIAHPINLVWQKLCMKDVEPMSHATAEEIRTRLLEQTELLEQMLGWDLTGWKPSCERDDAGRDQDEELEGEDLA